MFESRRPVGMLNFRAGPNLSYRQGLSRVDACHTQRAILRNRATQSDYIAGAAGRSLSANALPVAWRLRLRSDSDFLWPDAQRPVAGYLQKNTKCFGQKKINSPWRAPAPPQFVKELDRPSHVDPSPVRR